MALKDLLVYVDLTDGANVRLRLAADLARRHGSHLTALFVREPTPNQLELHKSAELGLATGQEMVELDQRMGASVEATARRLRSALVRLGQEHALATEWRDVDGPAADIVPEHARYADLTILGQNVTADQDSVEFSFAERLPLVSGRPVIYIPAAETRATLGRHILIAWNASRAAARAVKDALPLIEKAERTTVMVVDPAEVLRYDGALPLDRLLEHLRRHGTVIEAVRAERQSGESVAGLLQARARALDADLIVAGAYSHSKLLEQMLGGVTRDLLETMTLPLLLSH